MRAELAAFMAERLRTGAWHRLGATPTPPGPLAHGAPHPAALTDADSGQKP